MDCFPLDEELQTSIPFSNNSVVLAASALLQRLLTYADERNLQSVDVLLTSIWLLLRDGKYESQVENISDQVVSEKTNGKGNMSDNTCLCKVSYVEAETQTGTSTQDGKTEDILQNEKTDMKAEDECKVGQSSKSCHFKTSFCERTDINNEGTEKREKGMNISHGHEVKADSSLVSETNLAGVSEKQEHISAKENGSSFDSAKQSIHTVENTYIASSKGLLDRTGTRKPVGNKDNIKNKSENLSQVSSAGKAKEPINNLQKEPLNGQTFSKNYNVNDKIQKPDNDLEIIDTVPPQSLTQEHETASYTDKRLQLDKNCLKEPDTIVKTSDGRTFQISSNDGLTFEDSFVIEKVDTDDSDIEMNVDNSEKSEVAFTCDMDHLKISDVTDTKKEKRGGHKMAVGNVNIGNSDRDILAITEGKELANVSDHKKEKRGGHKAAVSNVNVGNSDKDIPALAEEKGLAGDHHCVASSTELIETPENVSRENRELPEEESYQRDKVEKMNRSLCGGIINLDNDSELKIINIAGGVTFYDDNEEDLPNDRIIDYIESKPGTSVYNPFSYSSFTPAQSSCTSLYSDVVYSSYSSFPGTYMSADPRLTIQNCPQYFIPNNPNMGACMGSELGRRLYQPAESVNQYENISSNINQGYQYYLPDENSTNLMQSVQVKSESKVIIPTKSKSKKKKKKKTPDVEMQPPKNYYNVRDPTGKFIRVENAPETNISKMYSPRSHQKCHVKKENVDFPPEDKTRISNVSKTIQKPHTSSGNSQGIIAMNQPKLDIKSTAKFSIRQLQKECKELDERLKALTEKPNTKLKKRMNEKEQKHKAFERRRLDILKKLRAEKKTLKRIRQLESEDNKTKKSSQDLKYVVKGKGTRMNSSGESEEYTVVTIKGLLQDPSTSGQDGVSVTEEGSVLMTELPCHKVSKKTVSKDEKEKTTLKVSLNRKQSMLSDKSNSKLKSAKQKAAAQKILKIKQVKTNKMKEVIRKNKQKQKQQSGNLPIAKIVAKPRAPEVNKIKVKKPGRGRPRKEETEKNTSKQNIQKVRSLLNKSKNTKKTRSLTQLLKAGKEKEQEETKNLVLAYHGERGAKLAAQQKISAYNESLSSETTTKGEN